MSHTQKFPPKTLRAGFVEKIGRFADLLDGFN